MIEQRPGMINSDVRKRVEGEASRLPNPNDEKKPSGNSIMLNRFHQRRLDTLPRANVTIFGLK